MRWNLTGTENQRAILRAAFETIKFPFDRLAQLPGTPEMGWRDLNGGRYAAAAVHSLDLARSHEGHHDSEDRPDAFEGEVDGRRWIMGLIYTRSGRIYLDVRLEQHPQLAMAVVAAEIAHAVDFFLPMTDDQRNELLRLWGKGGTWWEVSDYGSEYFRLGGEAFMGEFVAAYTDLPFDRSPFLHDAGVEPDDVRRVLGIERTDAPPKPLPFVHFPGGPDIYHKPTHLFRRGGRKVAGEPLFSLDGFRPCRICKPGA